MSARQGGSVGLGGAKLSIPRGSVSGHGYLHASAQGAPPTAATLTGAGQAALRPAGSSPPIHFTLTGARIVGSVRITFRVRPVQLPSGLPAASDASAIWLAFYDSGTHRWQPVASTYDPATRTVTAQVRHLSWWAPWTWDWQGLTLRLRQLLSALGSGRAPAATCPKVPQVTVTSAGGQDPPLIGCATKPGTGTLTASITNNRGVSAVVSGVPPDARQDPPSYHDFDAYIATRNATTRLLGGADVPPSETLAYSLPLHGLAAVFTAAPTVKSYALDLASIVGEGVVDEAKYGKLSGSYATCVLNAIARSEPASFADIPHVAVKCLGTLTMAIPALKGLGGPTMKILEADIALILQDYDLAHDAIRGVSGEAVITRPAVIVANAPCTSAALARALNATHTQPGGWLDSVGARLPAWLRFYSY